MISFSIFYVILWQELFVFTSAFGHRLDQDISCCDGCKKKVPIKSHRYLCMDCQNLDLCDNCFSCKYKYMYSHQRLINWIICRWLESNKLRTTPRTFRIRNAPFKPISPGNKSKTGGGRKSTAKNYRLKCDCARCKCDLLYNLFTFLYRMQSVETARKPRWISDIAE